MARANPSLSRATVPSCSSDAIVASSPVSVVLMSSSRTPCVPGIERSLWFEQYAEHSLRLERVSVLGERALHQRLGFLAGLFLLFSRQGLGLGGGDRLVPGLDRRLLFRLRDFAGL